VNLLLGTDTPMADAARYYRRIALSPDGRHIVAKDSPAASPARSRICGGLTSRDTRAAVPPCARRAACGAIDGAIAGRVRDSTGAPLPFAHITVGNGRQGAETIRWAITAFAKCKRAWHRVTARRIGFQAISRDSVLVQAGQTTIANFALSSPLELTPS